jgi:intergrase/recombinase
VYNQTLTFSNKDKFLEWLGIQSFTDTYTRQITNKFKLLYNKSFETPLALQKHISTIKLGKKDLILAARAYLNFCEQNELCEAELVLKYKNVLKILKSRQDVYVPSDNEVLETFKLISYDKELKLVYLVLATSGIRFGECLEFLKTFDESKFKVASNVASYNIANLRKTKNINNIYLPISVYKRLFYVSNTYDGLRVKLVKKHATISLKYLRKWHYNFMLYNNVPESVADFIQGRSNKSVSANHYMAKSQQAEFWYSKIVSKLEALFLTTEFDKNLVQTSETSHPDNIQSKETILTEDIK